MDKYEFKIKAEQMQHLVQKKDYKMAAKIADGIDWRRGKNVELLTTVSEIYEKMERYEDSFEILNMAYDRAPIGRTIVYKMTEMAIQMGDFEEARDLYKEFVDMAPHDLSRYILKYKIYQGKGAPVKEQIQILEEFKSREYHEKWAYELASLYYKEGMTAKCVEECDDLILWFSEGEYVRRAMELKRQIQPLTASQEEKYQELMKRYGKVTSLKEKKAAKAAKAEAAPKEDALREEPEEEQPVEEEIRIRTVNPDERYSTVNLQAELAEGLRDLLQEESPSEEEAEDFPESDIEAWQREAARRRAEEEAARRQAEEEEAARQAELQRKAEEKARRQEEARRAKEAEILRRKEVRRQAAEAEMRRQEEAKRQAAEEERRLAAQAEKALEQAEASREAESPVPESREQQEGERLRLGQSEDGQLTFNAEENILDRQITGQMTIEEVMAEWEAKKQQMKEKLDVLAEQEEERKKEAALQKQEEERLHRERQAAGLETPEGLPNLIPPDVQQLLDEIEGKLPVKIIVEPIERKGQAGDSLEEAGETVKKAAKGQEAPIPAQEEPEAGTREPVRGKEKPEELSGGHGKETGFPDIGQEVENDLPEDIDEIEKILTAALEEDMAELEKGKYAAPVEAAEQKPVRKAARPGRRPAPEKTEEEELSGAGKIQAEEEFMPESAREKELDGGSPMPEEPKREPSMEEEALEKELSMEEDDLEREPLEPAQTKAASKPPKKKRASSGRKSVEKEISPELLEREYEPVTNMMWDLEKVLEDELRHVSGKYLTEEQEKLFAYFTSVHGMNQQLSMFLEEEGKRELDGTSQSGNLVVTGESGNGKSTLAIDMVKAVQKQRRAKGSKVARVTGKALSQKDVAAVVNKLSGGALVIEHAGALTAEAASKLSSAMLGQTDNLFVVLEDEASEIKKLFRKCESLGAKFDKTIEIPVFTNNELVAFGKSYALEQGYVLDELAVLALYNRIGNGQTSDHLVNVSEVKEIIDDAVISASRKGVKKLFSKRRQDEFGNYVLLEKDFEE